MRTLITKSFACLLLALGIAACAGSSPDTPSRSSPGAETIPKATHPYFTRDAVSKLRPGIPLQVIENTFGEPDRTRATQCGPEKARWPCMILEYIMRDKQGHYQGRNELYLNMNHDPPVLNHWELGFVH